MATTELGWGRQFDPDRVALIELRAWKAYYRRQPLRLFALLLKANRQQARASWPRAFVAAFFLARGAVRFGRSTSDYDRLVPDVARGYRWLGLPAEVDADEVARRELRWWAVRRGMGPAAGNVAGNPAGEAITALYSALYRVPERSVAEAGELRGRAAGVRDHGAAADPDGPTGAGGAYWPEVARLLRKSYRSLHAALAQSP